MKQTITRFFCDFCGAENSEGQMTKVDIRGCVNGLESACPNCFSKILMFLQTLRDAGPSEQKPPCQPKWWRLGA